jgi:hypothetical protein
LGGGDSPPHPPVFRTDAERRKWNKSEGARKRSARRWTNWGLTPPGKLARYGPAGEGSSSGQSSRAPRLPVAESEEEDDLVPARSPTISAGDYVHGSDEEEAVLAQAKAISDAEARQRFRREEADAVRQVREYEAARREARVRRVKLEIVELDKDDA